MEKLWTAITDNGRWLPAAAWIKSGSGQSRPGAQPGARSAGMHRGGRNRPWPGRVGAATGLPASTVHRLLKSLEQRHYVVHDEDRGRWFIGVQAFSVGGAFLRGRNYAALARPIMRRLMEEAGETVNLAVEDRGEAVFLAQVECRQMMRALSQPGIRVPLHCSGVGKALLAALPSGSRRGAGKMPGRRAPGKPDRQDDHRPEESAARTGRQPRARLCDR